MRPASTPCTTPNVSDRPWAVVALVLLTIIVVALPPLPEWAHAQSVAPCSVNVSPGRNLSAAIASAPAGGTVCLAAGRYTKTLRLDHTTPSGLTLRGAGPDVTILDGLGGRDAALILNTSAITLQDLGLRGGVPTNAYVFNSHDVQFRNVVVSGGGIGIHIDAGSIAEVRDSVVSGALADGVLIRNGSSAVLMNSEIRDNGGVGVSAAGQVGRVQMSDSTVVGNRGPGFFAGHPPCQLLPPATVEAPPCYLADPGAFVASGDFHLNDNTLEGNGSTGLVFFPGTKAALFRNQINANLLTGLFVWGADVSALHNRFEENEEHAAEYRAYPEPRLPSHAPGTMVLQATGSFLGNTVKDTATLGTILGGGLLSQGSRLIVRDNAFMGNAGIGVSFVNGAEGEIADNHIMWNAGSALCLFRAGSVEIGKNVIGGNLADRPGVCATAR